MMRMLLRLAATATAASAAGLVLFTLASPAQAHPLGNFSVNQYLGLVLHPDRLDATAVVDIAEIPTLQQRPEVDTDADRTVSETERAAHATTMCAALAGAVEARIGDSRLEWRVASSSFEYRDGAGGLNVSRLSCALTAPAALGGDTTLSLTNGYLDDRIGWREITARGEGVGLVDPPVPATSVSDELRVYPEDLLTSALDVRSVNLRVTPGAGSGGAAPSPVLPSGGDPISRWLSTVDRYVADLAGGPLTPLVTLAAILLAVLLGAGHAALPGHGKTVLAAYLAGRAGRPRDALTVAGTVTLTHTGGVLILGLVITGGSAILGEQILGWLGVVSGVVVLVVGAGMLRSVLRRRKQNHDHTHGPDHDHDHEHDHGHGHGHSHGEHHAHDHGAQHDHAHGHGHGHDHIHPHGTDRRHGRDSGRWSLAGIGIAGGLVPSPSALVVLLAAIGLGRTALGVLLVLFYGAGMAATLTGAGLLLLAVQRRLARAANRTGTAIWANRLRGLGARLGAATPAATAALVLAVGAGLALRAATAVI
jgi:nickel/cobalt transporter (NicO) family protein